IAEDHVLTKRRRKIAEDDGKGGRTAQYSKLSREDRPYVKGLVFEQGQIFYVNLTDYLDTGLFFDHRPLRDTVRSECRQKAVLNLFCYTASFSVYAAEGGASFVESVDTSNTYLDWAKDNMAANGFTDKAKYIFTREDVSAYLDRKIAEKSMGEDGTQLFDIIILDPPTFSNSKRSDATLDINRDWPALVRKSLSLLTPDGILYFSTNSRRLVFEEQRLPSRMNGELLYKATDITAKTIPEDYRNTKIHRAWKIERIR
ncbi:MAG: class I SAM-dependent methyltransferase, partial [Treponema sp.]|nr:class I SAM-dependent methyltransferase [Treponema sp.]